MIFGILLFLILSSGSVLAAAYADRRYEEALPLTIFGIMAVFYFLGIFGALKSGLYTVLALAAAAYLLAGYQVIRRRDFFPFLKRIFTPGFCFFVVFYILSIYCNRGMVVNAWDEFTHWADTVKVMFLMQDFGTSALAHTLFPSYPPAMATFQYFIQVFHQLLYDTGFTEWLLYTAYQIACVALFVPCLKRLRWKNVTGMLFAGVGAIVIPTIAFPQFYSWIYADAYLGLLAGFCIAYPFVIEKKNGPFQLATFCSAVFTLMLVKQSGMLFALMSAAGYIVGLCLKYYKNKKDISTGFSINKKSLIISCLIVISVLLLAKLSWSVYLSIKEVKLDFNGKVDIPELFTAVFGNSGNYRRQTLINFVNGLFSPKFPVGDTSIKISFIFISVLLLLGKVLLSWQEDKHFPEGRILRKCMDICSIFTFILYSGGLCIMYMFKFSETEALSLASLERYLGSGILAILFLQFARLIYLIPEKGMGKRELCATAAVLLFFSPLGNIGKHLTRVKSREIAAWHEPYISYAEKLTAAIPGEGQRIFLVAQDIEGFCYPLFHYRLRPQYVVNRGKTDLDVSVGISEEELRDNYDYVALYALNDYFIDNFSHLFEDPAEIGAECLYRVTEDGKLVRIPIG